MEPTRTPMFRVIPTPRNEITEESVIQNEVEKNWYKGQNSKRRGKQKERKERIKEERRTNVMNVASEKEREQRREKQLKLKEDEHTQKVLTDKKETHEGKRSKNIKEKKKKNKKEKKKKEKTKQHKHQQKERNSEMEKNGDKRNEKRNKKEKKKKKKQKKHEQNEMKHELGKAECKRYEKKKEELQKKKEEHLEGKEITDHIEKKKDISENRDAEKKKREDTDDGNTGSIFEKTVEMSRGQNKKRKRDEDAKYDGGKNDVQKRIKQIERDQVEDNKTKTWKEIQTRPEHVEIGQVIRKIPANEIEKKEEITSVGKKKLDEIKNEKNSITITYYKEHYGIRTSSSHDQVKKTEKESKARGSAENTEENESNILKKNQEMESFLENLLRSDVPDIVVKIWYNKKTRDRNAYLITNKEGVKPSEIVQKKIKQESTGEYEMGNEEEVIEIIVIDD